MLDASSTAVYIAKALKERKNLTLITNSIEILIEMFDTPNVNVLSTGGAMREGSFALVGPQTDKMLNSYHVDIADTQVKYLRMRKGGEERQDDKIIAPMPGKVMKIPVQKGDRLSAGNIVVVLEAMKMQSNYKVNSDCVVREILVAEGDSVSSNQI